MSPTLSLLISMLVYPLILAGDGCILIAIALVATAGGNPYVCGASFAFFHALYALIGIALTSQLAHYSETLGETIVFIGALVLLKHFVHHRLHHGANGDCSCEHHNTSSLGSWQIVSSAAALSLHSLAAGAIVQQLTGIEDRTALAGVLLGSSCILGALITVVVLVGESRRSLILKKLDSLPGIVTSTLTAITCYAMLHLIEHMLELSATLEWAFIAISILASVGAGIWMHSRSGPILVTKIGKRQGRLIV